MPTFKSRIPMDFKNFDFLATKPPFFVEPLDEDDDNVHALKLRFLHH
jgi:hypothetical protein